MGFFRKMKRDRARMHGLIGGKAPVNKEAVFIGVPCVNEYLHVGVHRFLVWADRLSLDPKHPFSYGWQIMTGKRPIEYARNLLAGTFLRSGASRFLMLDDDMVPKQDIFNLLDVDGDIVAPCMFAKKGSAEIDGEPRLEICAYMWNLKGDHKFNSIIPQPGQSVLDVEGVGTGFIVVRRRVMEDRRLWQNGEFEWHGVKYACDKLPEDEPDEWAPPIFRTNYAPNGKILRGEDLDFSRRAHELGYTIRAHMGIRCGHAKVCNLDDMALFANNAISRALKAHGVAIDADTGQVESPVERSAAAGGGGNA